MKVYLLTFKFFIWDDINCPYKKYKIATIIGPSLRKNILVVELKELKMLLIISNLTTPTVPKYLPMYGNTIEKIISGLVKENK